MLLFSLRLLSVSFYLGPDIFSPGGSVIILNSRNRVAKNKAQFRGNLAKPIFETTTN